MKLSDLPIYANEVIKGLGDDGLLLQFVFRETSSPSADNWFDDIGDEIGPHPRSSKAKFTTEGLSSLFIKSIILGQKVSN